LFIDYNTTRLFGGRQTYHVSPSSRGFTFKNKKKVQKYLDHLEEYWIDHKISAMIQTLAEAVKQLEPRDIKCHWEAINWDATRGMVAAEKKVKGSGQQLDAAGYRLQYWKARLFDARNNSMSSCRAVLKEWANVTDAEEEVHLTWQEIEKSTGGLVKI